ncbi:MAG: DUF1214 domain-containing protein, partial [Marmoricola sp.]
MTENNWESTAAWNELLTGLGELQESFLEGDRAVSTETGVVNGYRMLATILGVGLDIYLYPEKSRPVWVDTVTPFRRDRRWGGDNTDAAYAFCVFDPERTYRIWGRRNDSAYFSVTVYNEPAPGSWSDKVIGVVNDSDLTFDADGGFSFYLGAQKPEGYDGPWIQFTPDTAAALTRDYQADPLTGTPVAWKIECLDEPEPVLRSDAATAQALRSTLSWMRTMFAIVRDTDVSSGPDGDFAFDLGPLPEAAVLLTRDYQADPLTGRRIAWRIEALDDPDPIAHGTV